jgi:hypothetical protein
MEIRATVPVEVTNMPGLRRRTSKSKLRLLALDYNVAPAPFHVDPMRP